MRVAGAATVIAAALAGVYIGAPWWAVFPLAFVGAFLFTVGEVRHARRVRRVDLEAGLRPCRAWDVDVRVPKPVSRLELAAFEGMELEDLRVDPFPPAAGPEVELSFRVWASSADTAERIGTRRVERYALMVLAVRARPA